MLRSAQTRIITLFLKLLWGLLWGLLWLSPLAARADSASPPPAPAEDSSGEPGIVIGFQGGLVHNQVAHFREALARMHDEYGVRTELVYNGVLDRKRAARAVVQWLDTDGDGKLSNQEKQRARIILLGHSWGGPAALAFARDLKRQHIPVLLTIQIDSVAKLGEPGRVVPANVKEAVNFYQRKGFFILKGRSKIVAADPAATRILGNYNYSDDLTQRAGCTDYNILLRTLNPYHIAIECDARLWSRVDALVGAQLAAAESATANGN